MDALIKATVLLCLPCIVTASCFSSLSYHTEFGDFCVYEPSEADWQFLLPGDYYTDEAKCLNCTCYHEELGCCGYGIMAGVSYFPPGCRRKMIDSCNFQIVKEDDENQEC